MWMLLVVCPYLCIYSQWSVKLPWDTEICPLSLYYLAVPGKTGLPLHRALLPVSDWRSVEVGCAVVLLFLVQLCTDDAQSRTTGSLDLRHTFQSKNKLFFLLCLKLILSRSALLYLTIRELLIAVGSPVPGQCPLLYHPMPAFLHAASHFSTFQGFCYHTGAVLLYTTSLC